MKKLLLMVFVLLLVNSCADSVSFEQAATMDPAGFWFGLWNGMTAGISFIGSLFNDDIAIYAIYNNGGWYDFGYVIGIGGIFGTGRSIMK